MKFRLIFTSLFLLLLWMGPVFAPRDPSMIYEGRSLQPPDGSFLLGTDYLGRDVFSRLLYGGQRTITAAVLAALIAAVPGVIIGSGLSYMPLWAEGITKMMMTVLLAFPPLITALMMLTLFGNSPAALIVAVGLSNLPYFAHNFSLMVKSARVSPHIEASTALGGSAFHQLRWHILPDTSPLMLSLMSIVFSYSLLNSAALSFLGLGGAPGMPDWGIMLAEGRNGFRLAPWSSIAPGLALTILVLLINDLVDSINQAKQMV